MLDQIQGEVISARILGRDFWGVAKLRPSRGPEVAVVGKLLGVQPGDTVRAEGAWATHPRFGRQFKVRSINTIVPQDSSGVVAWLASRVPHLGPKRAAALVAELGAEGVWDVIEHSPKRLLEVRGITPKRMDAIVKAYWRHREDRDRIVALKSYGLTDGQIARVLEEWGPAAEAKLRKDPYALCDHVHGFGFKRADGVAQRMGLPADSPARIRAGLLYMLTEAAEAHGHAYVPAGKLVAMSAKLLELDELPVRRELGALLEAGRAVAEGPRIALAELHAAERDMATMVARALRREAV